MHHSVWGVTRVEQKGRIIALDLLATLQDFIGFLGCNVSCQTTCPESFSSELHSIHSPPSLCLCLDYLDQVQVQDLALALVELHEVFTGPLLKPVKVSLEGAQLSLLSVDDSFLW